jgi:hypothetical protein
VCLYLKEQVGLDLQGQSAVEIGLDRIKKLKRFDLGSEKPAIIVECKAYAWRQKGVPNAKNNNLTEALLELAVAPKHYRRTLFIARDLRKGISLASNYIACYGHLIHPSVEIWELDVETGKAERLTA